MVDENGVLHYETTSMKNGFMGECAEFPSVVVYAKTEKEIEAKLVTALTGYIKIFPEEINAEEEKIKHIPRKLIING